VQIGLVTDTQIVSDTRSEHWSVGRRELPLQEMGGLLKQTNLPLSETCPRNLEKRKQSA
jgi:hypothetical protein